MPKSTQLGGALIPINECYVDIPGAKKIILDNLPDISDTKSANYSDEVVIGRASPLKTYSQSDNRSITMQIHFIISKPEDVKTNLENLRALQSACYPREGEGGAPFIPPPVCKIKCGKLLSEKGEVCVILKSYSVKFPTDVAWHADEDDNKDAFTPTKFDVDTTWDVVYSSADLPGQQKIFSMGV